MIGRYKKTIIKLAGFLRKIEADPADCALLQSLQSSLIKLIKSTDRRLVALRATRAALVRQKSAGRLVKVEADALKGKIRRIEDSVADVQRIQFFWRSFGDAIAFVYCDKLALKHMFFNAHNYEVKPPAGALTQKAGLALEWRILRTTLEHGVPAVLCDITNVLRHGDVCLLVGPDPIPIEVKSSANINARVSRQVGSLRAIGQFLRQDEAAKFRGLSYVRRATIATSRNHSDAMNLCISRSRRRGYAIVSPESSLTYACIRAGNTTEDVVRKMRIGPDCLLTMLNEAKSEMAWRYYYPFSLSIRSPTALYEFLHGDFLLIVVVRLEPFICRCAEKGLRLEYLDEPDWIFAVSDAKLPTDTAPRGAISRAFFMRAAYDFDSAEDLCSAQLAFLGDQPETAMQLAAWEEPPSATEVAGRPRFKKSVRKLDQDG